MAVLQMQKVSICALKRDRKAILERSSPWGSWKYPRSRKISRDWKR